MPRVQHYEKYLEAKKLLDGGKAETINEACRMVGIPWGSYQHYDTKAKGLPTKPMSTPKRKKFATKRPKVPPMTVTTLMPSHDDHGPVVPGRIFALVGAPKEVMEAIRSVM
jgi:hypothetical protein